MAPTRSRLLPAAFAPVFGLPAVAASSAAPSTLRWHGQISDLDFRSLSASAASKLSSVYAEEVAAALGVEVGDVFDLSGSSVHVTLTSGSYDPLQNTSSIAEASSSTTVGKEVVTDTNAFKQSTAAVTVHHPGLGRSSPKRSLASVASASSSLGPLRGLCYGALPCTKGSCSGLGMVSEDMVQVGYEAQWGAEGRDDLGVMAQLGANAVRLYHSLGLKVNRDHGAFLDYAGSQGIKVLPGYHTEMVTAGGECPDFDCYDAWKKATLHGFKHGYKQGNKWHSAVGALVLLNEPDFFDYNPMCGGRGSMCHLKASLSALDGVLAAEREAGLTSTKRVKLTVAWSFGMRTSIDGKVTGPGLFGFQDIVVGIADPQLANYTPRSSLEEMSEAFRTRWVHCLNTQAPWGFVQAVIGSSYDQFLPTPWFIGEYGANGQPEDVIRGDLEAMQSAAEKGNGFIGAAIFQFQTAYFKGGSEKNFGLFELKRKKVLDTAPVCSGKECRSLPVRCLTPELSFLPGSLARRAYAVADAWGGAVDVKRGVCKKARRLMQVDSVLTNVACDVHLGLSANLETSSVALNSDEFASRLAARTLAELGTSSPAVKGELDVISRSMSITGLKESGGDGFNGSFFGLASGIVTFIGGAASCIVCQLRQSAQTQSTKEAATEPGV